MDQRLVRCRPRGGDVTVLRRRRARTQLRSVSAGDPHSAQSAQGRVVSLFAQLLSALSSGRALAAGDRHRHVAPRLPLRERLKMPSPDPEIHMTMSEVLNMIVA